MQLTFYDTRIKKNSHITLVKDKVVDYGENLLDAPKRVVEMVNSVVSLNMLGEEHCYMIAMNTKSKVLGIFLLSKGTVNQSIVGAREVFMRALLVGAVNIILLHNHPSSDCTPSREDETLTKRFREAGVLLGVKLSDHIIVGGDDYYSFHEHKKL